ncbi:hypothetical protein [Mucilaginibacter sp. CSA2-8R]|uniref:hypothetical protein n=1 Tax=Mucilaginibacter sp. CSA2-8R TaxID=3141542 RepID=UPI00315C5509
MTNLFYNPFLPVNNTAVSRLIENETPYIVIQRFEWPGVPFNKGFLITAYSQEHEAELHVRELAPNEGKLQNLLDETDCEKIIALTGIGSGYFVFFNGTIDLAHEKKLQKAYVKNVHGYIKYIRMPKDGGYDVRIFVEHGRVKATITSGTNSHTAFFYTMIK